VDTKSYRDLKVWQSGMELATDLYRITESFPTYERSLLTTELRRAGIEIVSSIAEGHGRASRGESMKHAAIARGSAIDVEVQLLLAERLGYVGGEPLALARARCESIRQSLRESRSSAKVKRRTGKQPRDRKRNAP
jgi:four helix bundle protein